MRWIGPRRIPRFISRHPPCGLCCRMCGPAPHSHKEFYDDEENLAPMVRADGGRAAYVRRLACEFGHLTLEWRWRRRELDDPGEQDADRVAGWNLSRHGRQRDGRRHSSREHPRRQHGPFRVDVGRRRWDGPEDRQPPLVCGRNRRWIGKTRGVGGRELARTWFRIKNAYRGVARRFFPDDRHGGHRGHNGPDAGGIGMNVGERGWAGAAKGLRKAIFRMRVRKRHVEERKRVRWGDVNRPTKKGSMMRHNKARVFVALGLGSMASECFAFKEP